MMIRKEADIKKSIIEYLKIRKNLVIPQRTIGLKTENGYIPAMRRGVSDIIGCTPTGKFFAIEVKTEKGRPTQEQLDFLVDVQRHEGIVFIARSVNDVVERGL